MPQIDNQLAPIFDPDSRVTSFTNLSWSELGKKLLCSVILAVFINPGIELALNFEGKQAQEIAGMLGFLIVFGPNLLSSLEDIVQAYKGLLPNSLFSSSRHNEPALAAQEEGLNAHESFDI